MFGEPVQSTRAVQRDATRSKVLAAAEALFAEQGFGATSIRQIADRAGVSVGTVMASGDKGALLVEIFDAWISAVHDLRESTPRESGPLTPEQALAEVAGLFGPFVAYFSGDQDLAREYAATIVRGRHPSLIFRGLGDRLVDEVADLAGRAGVADPRQLADTVYLSYLGVLFLASHGALSPDEAALRLEAVVRSLLLPSGATP